MNTTPARAAPPTPSLIRGSCAFFAFAIIAAIWSAPRPASSLFSVAPPVAPAGDSPSFRWLDLPHPTASAHASSMTAMPDGSWVVAWFGGSREGARDVAIHMARLSAETGEVVEEWVSLTREQLASIAHRVIRKLGNPVIWVASDGRLRMHVVSVSYGGWSGSSINQLTSNDGGKSWTDCRRLILSPLFNFSTLVRNQAVAMNDGTIGLPAYHEFLGKWGLWVHLAEDGTVMKATRMQKYDGGWLQPAVAPLSSTDAFAALRSASRFHPAIGVNRTTNAGASWPKSRIFSLEIPNPNSSVAMIRLADGSLLIAANPLKTGRNLLQLFRSSDGGTTWVASRTIERDELDTSSEFSYPCLVAGDDGLIRLSYTWKRKGIRLCVFTQSWLDATGDVEMTRPAVEGNPP